MKEGIYSVERGRYLHVHEGSGLSRELSGIGKGKRMVVSVDGEEVRISKRTFTHLEDDSQKHPGSNDYLIID